MYHLLRPEIEPLPQQGADFPALLQWGFRTIIIVAGLAGFVMLFITGFQYMFSDKVTNKGYLRGRMQEILLGVLLAVGSYAILQFINPRILSLDFFQSIKTAEEATKD